MFWNGSRWSADETLDYMTRTRDYLREKANEFVQAAIDGEIEMDVETAEVWAKTLRGAPMVANVLVIGIRGDCEATAVSSDCNVEIV